MFVGHHTADRDGQGISKSHIEALPSHESSLLDQLGIAVEGSSLGLDVSSMRSLRILHRPFQKESDHPPGCFAYAALYCGDAVLL